MKPDAHCRRLSSSLTDDPMGGDPFSRIEFDFPDLWEGSGTGWLKKVIKAIGRTTKRAAKAVAAGAVRIFRYLGRQWREGAEIHNHSVTHLDDRYAQNFYYLRSMM